MGERHGQLSRCGRGRMSEALDKFGGGKVA
jgi:hypothetical protein